MKKKLLALILVLALTIGAATLAQAFDSDGSIVFEDGNVIIIDPGCCECYGLPPATGCICECHEHDSVKDTSNFRTFNLGGELFFGTWEVGSHGIFKSADTVQTTAAGTHTGMFVVNQTTSAAKVGVSITEFIFDTEEFSLEGAELTLVAYGLEVGDGTSKGTVTQNPRQRLEPGEGAVLILTTPLASRVKAAWSGELVVAPGTANRAETAQALLTWEVSDIL